MPWFLCTATASGQEEDADDKKKIEDVDLVTGDAVKLVATYYHGSEGKDTVPIILLHGLKGSRQDYASLAKHLQAQGHAVLVPDLRGHGDSTQRKNSPVPLSASTLPRAEFERMVRYDMQALKAYLVAKNNAGKLNIEKLCVVGAEMGSSVALTWTYYDWTRPLKGNFKQGQDVKAIVAMSPEWSTTGLPLRNVMQGQPLRTMANDPQLRKVFKEPEEINFQLPVVLDFRREVSVMIVVGKLKSSAVGDATRLEKIFKSFHPDPPKSERLEKQDLFYGALSTRLQGTKMLDGGLGLERHIARFIELRVAQRPFSWSQRKSDPYAGER